MSWPGRRGRRCRCFRCSSPDLRPHRRSAHSHRPTSIPRSQPGAQGIRIQPATHSQRARASGSPGHHRPWSPKIARSLALWVLAGQEGARRPCRTGQKRDRCGGPGRRGSLRYSPRGRPRTATVLMQVRRTAGPDPPEDGLIRGGQIGARRSGSLEEEQDGDDGNRDERQRDRDGLPPRVQGGVTSGTSGVPVRIRHCATTAFQAATPESPWKAPRYHGAHPRNPDSEPGLAAD